MPTRPSDERKTKERPDERERPKAPPRDDEKHQAGEPMPDSSRPEHSPDEGLDGDVYGR